PTRGPRRTRDVAVHPTRRPCPRHTPAHTQVVGGTDPPPPLHRIAFHFRGPAARRLTGIPFGDPMRRRTFLDKTAAARTRGPRTVLGQREEGTWPLRTRTGSTGTA